MAAGSQAQILSTGRLCLIREFSDASWEMGKEGMNETQLGYKLDTDLNQTGLQARGRGRPSAHGQLGLPGCAEGARGHRCPPPFPDKRLWT